MTTLDERGAQAADELRRELASVPVPEPTRLIRRARHTRIVTAAAAALVLGVGSLAVARAVDSSSSISTGNQPRGAQHDAPSFPHRDARAVPKPPTPLGAPLVQGPDAASTLLTSWSQFHVGYAFVYADGRVLFYPDVAADFLPKGVTQYEVYERHLSPRGLDLVRAGKLKPRKFLVRTPHRRDELWVEPTPRLWEPPTYALCPSPIGGGGLSVNATDIVDELPGPVQAVLDGKQRIFDPSIGTAHWEFPGTAPLGMTDCFELTAAETASLYQMLVANGLINKDQEAIQGAQGWDRVFVYGNLSFVPEPIFPHGQYVIWGG